jgi:ATP-dependent DNA helicase RecG
MTMDRKRLEALVAQGEGVSLELKTSTSQLAGGFQTLCAFLNGAGGTVVFGVSPKGALLGQEVSDTTLRQVAEHVGFLEPTAKVDIQRVAVGAGREALVLSVQGGSPHGPFAYDGRPYMRVASTTRRMPQAAYAQRLQERTVNATSWESLPAVEVGLEDLAVGEVRRVVAMARAAKRLVAPGERNVTNLLRKFKVLRGDVVLQAGVVLFGKEQVFGYPQCTLKLARFRGTDKQTFIDQQRVHGPAFKLLDAALEYCDRFLPVAGRIVPGRLQREDKALVPVDSLREILVNAFIHRDYTMYGSTVSVAIFDDRVEVWSPGRLPAGIAVEDLARAHESHPRNPIIAEAFHRAGLIEMWGRGTNRVVEECLAWGIPAPEFEQLTGSVVVRFRVPVGVTLRMTPQDTIQDAIQVTRQDAIQVTPQVLLVLEAAREARSREELQAGAGLRNRSHFVRGYLAPLLKAGWLEMTIPTKPNSGKQRYRTTAAGLAVLVRPRSS